MLLAKRDRRKGRDRSEYNRKEYDDIVGVENGDSE